MTSQSMNTVVRQGHRRVAQQIVGGRRPTDFWGYVFLIMLLAFAAGPIVIFMLASLKTRPELAHNAFGLPEQWQWSNFVEAWTEANMGLGLFNSAIILLGTVAIVVVASGMAAYSMARLDVPGGSNVLLYLLVIGSLPMQLFLVPLFYLATESGLYDTHLGVIIIYSAVFSPFATLLLRAFLISLPRELEEAARIDGASEFGVAWRIVLPNALPGILTIALITALSAYNEFLFAVTFLQSQEKMPVATTFFSFQTGYSQNAVLIAAAGVIMLVPMLLLFILLQRRFVDGMAASGMSG